MKWCSTWMASFTLTQRLAFASGRRGLSHRVNGRLPRCFTATSRSQTFPMTDPPGACVSASASITPGRRKQIGSSMSRHCWSSSERSRLTHAASSTSSFVSSRAYWYSEPLTQIDDDPGAQIDLRAVRSMLEHFIQQKSSWRVPDAIFRQNWPRERRRGRVRFIVTHGIFPWGMVAGLAFGAVAGHGVTGALPPLRVVLWFIAGILLGDCLGFWRWNRSEQRYKVLTAQNEIAR